MCYLVLWPHRSPGTGNLNRGCFYISSDQKWRNGWTSLICTIYEKIFPKSWENLVHIWETGYIICASQCKIKMQGPSSEMIKNFKMATEEHPTKHGPHLGSMSLWCLEPSCTSSCLLLVPVKGTVPAYWEVLQGDLPSMGHTLDLCNWCSREDWNRLWKSKYLQRWTFRDVQSWVSTSGKNERHLPNPIWSISFPDNALT